MDGGVERTLSAVTTAEQQHCVGKGEQKANSVERHR